MNLLVAITEWDPEPWLERFRRHLPGRRVVAPGEPFDRRAVRYAATWRHPPGSLAGLPALEVIFSLGAGVDHLLADPRLPEGVPVVRVIDPNLTGRMSEYVLLHCLLALRRQRLYDGRQRERLWKEDEQPPAGAVTVGVMGLGELGQDAARKLRLVGFQVVGWSRRMRSVEGVETFAGDEGLGSFLARADILVCLLPLTAATRGLLGADLFARCKRSGPLGAPVLINAGRGGLQVEADIVEALDAGRLQAATLDVFEVEPLPSQSPLWSHPKVTVTPHNAAMSEPEAVARRISGQILAHERGEALEGVVDRGEGY